MVILQEIGSVWKGFCKICELVSFLVSVLCNRCVAMKVWISWAGGCVSCSGAEAAMTAAPRGRERRFGFSVSRFQGDLGFGRTWLIDVHIAGYFRGKWRVLTYTIPGKGQTKILLYLVRYFTYCIFNFMGPDIFEIIGPWFFEFYWALALHNILGPMRIHPFRKLLV